MQTLDHTPEIIMTPHARKAKLVQLADMLGEMETFATLIRMAARALDGASGDAIASGAIEVLSRVEDCRDMIAEIKAA